MSEFEHLTQYYERYDEDGRLSLKYGQVEYLTTMRYIEKYLKPGMRILEIGAGTGRYSHALACKGYQVDAVELIQHNIDIFNSKTILGENIAIRQGDATNLSFIEDNTYDMTLMLGPMYHLYEENQQKAALSEALRVTKKGALLYIAYCLTEATIINFCFQKGHIFEMLNKGLINPDTFKAYSTPAEIFQLYRIEDIEALMSNFNTKRLHYVATDLYTNYMRDEIASMSDEMFELYLKYHFAVCERKDLTGISHHSLDIVEKL